MPPYAYNSPLHLLIDDPASPSPRLVTRSTSSSSGPSKDALWPVAFGMTGALLWVIVLSLLLLGRWRRRKGYPKKYWFDPVPKDKVWYRGGKILQVLVDGQEGLRIERVRVPKDGILMGLVTWVKDESTLEKDENGESTVGGGKWFCGCVAGQARAKATAEGCRQGLEGESEVEHHGRAELHRFRGRRV